MADIDADIDAVIARIEKHYKRPILQRASEASSPFQLRRPTGILSLDLGMGGGFPAGGVCQIAAPPGIGKNALCNLVLSRCQKTYGDRSNVAWIWTEVPYDKQHARLNGVIVPSSNYEIDTENHFRLNQGWKKLTVNQISNRKKEVGNFVIGQEGSTAEKLQATVELVRENKFQVIILDSIAAVVSTSREDTDLDDEPQQSAEARLVTEFQKKLWHAYGNTLDGQMNLTTLIVINQVRANRAKRSAFEREWKVGGAYAIRHGKLVDVWLTSGSKIWLSPSGKETMKKEKGYNLIGKHINWAIEKGKAGCHEGPSGEIQYYFKHGFNIYSDLINTAKAVEVLFVKRGGWTLTDEHGEVILEGQGESEELESKALVDDKFFDLIYQLALRKRGIQCVYDL